MAFDAHKNLAIASVVTPPSPAASGTTIVVGAGQGARFGAVPFNATVWPIDMAPDPTTAEVVRVTARTTDTLTIVRAQEGTTARTILAGDLIAATITALSLTDIESGVNFPLITTGAITGTTGTFSGTVTTPTLAHATAIAFSTAATVRGQMHNSGGFSWGGTTDPGAGNLSVGGALSFGGSGTIINRTNDGADTNYMHVGSGGGIGATRGGCVTFFGNEYAGPAGQIEFLAGDTPTGRISFGLGPGTPVRGLMHPSGGFSWGSTTDPGAANIHVAGTITTKHPTGGAGLVIQNMTNTAGDYNVLFTNSGGGVAGGITVVSATAVAYNTTSDARLKTPLNRHTDPSVLRDTIIHNFTWKADGSAGRGVFAQEAVHVLPAAVSVGGDERDAGGNLTRPWGVDYSKYVPDLITGWQQHHEYISNIGDRLMVHEALIQELRDSVNSVNSVSRINRSIFQRIREALAVFFPAWITP